MKIGHFLLSLMLSILFFVVGCSSKLETFDSDPNGYYGPVGQVEYVEGEPLPGKIKLTWSVPDDSSYQYLQVSYFDHLTQKERHHVLSIYANELVVEQTAKRFGDYTFRFQAFNANHQRGRVVTAVAQSGIAPKEERLVATKVVLSGEQFTYKSINSGSSIEYLIDNDITTFFQTNTIDATDANKNKAPHYLQIKLKNPLTKFQLMVQNASSKSKVFSKKVEVQTSENGSTWTTLETLTGSVPSSINQFYTDVYTPAKPINYIRWNVQSSNASNGVSWSLGLLELYSVETVVFDPEAE